MNTSKEYSDDNDRINIHEALFNMNIMNIFDDNKLINIHETLLNMNIRVIIIIVTILQFKIVEWDHLSISQSNRNNFKYADYEFIQMPSVSKCILVFAQYQSCLIVGTWDRVP